jgi:tetratricopeptide (TPR) repeat protein
LDVPVSAPPAAGNAAPSVPRELPAGVRHFAGRAGELEMLTRLLYESDEKVPCMVISAIGGTAGVGKTALALHWAHRAAGRFPDGQLYVNLRGYDPGQPMSATDALTGFLRALGVPGQNIPAGQDERAARYRSLLAGRRMLVILDNASEAEQVRPLLPGSPACAVVVTSRDALVGLVARDGATRLDLDLLPEEDAVGLLRALIGTRVNAEPEAAKALAGQCCRLPLALRVAAELAASRPAVALADLAGELADQQKRLDLLEAGGDSRSAMRAVFSWSCRYLDAGSARQFRLLGLHPGPDFGPYAAAALTGTTVEQACQMLDVLARAHLIQPVPPGRYGMHDLLRAYARELAAAQDADEERRTALAGLFDHYLHAAAAAMDAMFPAEEHQRPRPLAPTQPVPPLPTPAAARDWLEAERACLAAVTVQATADGWPGHAIALASILYRYAESGGHSPDTRALYTSALRAARQTGNLAAQADTLKNLGLVDTWQNHYRQAVGELGSALDLYRKIGDRLGEARTLNSLGIGHFRLGRLQQAGFHHQQAVALFRELGERLGEAAALTNLGIAELRQGLYDRAAGHHLECVAIFRELGDRHFEAFGLINLGEALCRQDRYQQAEDHLGRALAIFREFGNRRGEAYALQNLGHVLQGQARYQQAAGFHRQALALFREIGDRSTEAASLNSLGEALSGAGLHGPARAQHDDALAVACQIGDRYEQARAHNGIASSHHAVGDPGQARHHWQQALNLYAELGAPEADHVRAQLSTAHDDGHSES